MSSRIYKKDLGMKCPAWRNPDIYTEGSRWPLMMYSTCNQSYINGFVENKKGKQIMQPTKPMLPLLPLFFYFHKSYAFMVKLIFQNSHCIIIFKIFLCNYFIAQKAIISFSTLKKRSAAKLLKDYIWLVALSYYILSYYILSSVIPK